MTGSGLPPFNMADIDPEFQRLRKERERQGRVAVMVLVLLFIIAGLWLAASHRDDGCLKTTDAYGNHVTFCPPNR